MLFGSDSSRMYSEYAASKIIIALCFFAYATKVSSCSFARTAPVGLFGLQRIKTSTFPFGSSGINPSSSGHFIYTTFLPAIIAESLYAGYTGSLIATILSSEKIDRILAQSDLAPSLMNTSSGRMLTFRLAYHCEIACRSLVFPCSSPYPV